MTHLLLPGMLEQQGSAAAFDVENDISWHSLWWADSSEMTAAYADTNSVDPFYDTSAVGNNCDLQLQDDYGSGPPFYSTSVSAFNNKNVVTFASNDTLSIQHTGTPSTPPWVDMTSYSVVSVVTIASVDSTSATRYLHDGATGTEQKLYWSGTSSILVDNGSAQSATVTRDTAAHLFVAVYRTSGNEELDIDGTNVINAASGTGTLTNGFTMMSIWGGSSSSTGGDCALQALYEGDVRNDSAWADFTTWAESYYGLTIA